MDCVIDASWRQLREPDDDEITNLIRRCHDADGGLPLEVSLPLLQAAFRSGTTVGAFADRALIAAAAVDEHSGTYSTVGMVDPRHRGQGLGTQLLRWALNEAAATPLTVVSEMVTPAATSLYARYAMLPTQEELVMRRDLPAAPESVELPHGVYLAPWSDERAPLFFAAYVAAFQERPGFPGWSEQEWVEWATGDEDFRADLSAVALDRQHRPLGFVVVGANWIVQLGVAPNRRAGVLAPGSWQARYAA
jgi:GNAT superfamily N-acetyltransferase